jgi:hypothetical protein
MKARPKSPQASGGGLLAGIDQWTARRIKSAPAAEKDLIQTMNCIKGNIHYIDVNL